VRGFCGLPAWYLGYPAYLIYHRFPNLLQCKEIEQFSTYCASSTSDHNSLLLLSNSLIYCCSCRRLRCRSYDVSADASPCSIVADVVNVDRMLSCHWKSQI